MIQKSKGLLYEDDKIEVFFGNKNFSLQELTGLKPTGVHSVNQTHSDIFHVIDREEPMHPKPEGDALGTSLRKQYLVIKTADCLPVMIHDADTKRVAAIHAGWKGVANLIVPKTIEKYFSESKNLRLFVGPHITKASFEIKSDVLVLLEKTLSVDDWKKVNIESKGDRFFLDLVEIVKLQISSRSSSLSFTLENSQLDTKTSLYYNSYRRDSRGAGRNISYVKLK